MLRRSLLGLALIASAFSSSGAQSLAQLPRATVATGMNDSTLVYVSDSAKRSRAAVALDFRKMLSLRAFDSLVTSTLRLPGTLNLTGGSITGSPSATFGAITVSSCSGCAPAVVDSATGAARAQVLTTPRTIGGTSFNGSANIVPGLSDSATGANRAQVLTTPRTIGGTSFNGSANIVPGLSDSSTGSARAQILTTARTIGGVSFNGSANIIPDTATGSARAQVLTTARTIGGTSFNGSANIVPGLSDSATGATRAQKLTTARTIGGVSFDGTANILPDSAVGAARASALVGAPAITVSSCTGCAPSVTVSDTVKLVTFDTVKATKSAFGNGTVALPSLALLNSRTTGLYRFGADSLGLAASGRLAVAVRDSQMLAVFGRQSRPTYAFIGDTAVGAFRPGANQYGIAIANNVQALFTSTGIYLRANGANRVTLDATEVNITGLVRFSTTGATEFLNLGVSGTTTQITGIGTSQAIALRTVTSGGTTKNTLVLGADTSTTLLGKALIGDTLRFTNTGVIQAGTGNTKLLHLRATSNSGTLWTALRLASDTSRMQTDTLTLQGFNATGTLLRGNQLIVQSGVSGSNSLTLRTLNASNVTKDNLVLAPADSSTTALGKMAAPGFSLSGSASPGAAFVGNGMYMAGTNPVIARGSTDIMTFGSASVTLGTGVYRSPSGTNNSPTYAFNTSTNAGMFLHAADTIAFGTNSTERLLIANQAATGAGDVSLCVTTTKVITQGAACGTSSAKAKTGFGSIFNPVEKTMALRPVGYSYIPGMYDGRHEYGLVADSTMAVDSTLVFRAPTDQLLPNGQTIRKGEALNVNDRAVLALLTATVQELVTTSRRQQVTIDSLMRIVDMSKHSFLGPGVDSVRVSSDTLLVWNGQKWIQKKP